MPNVPLRARRQQIIEAATEVISREGLGNATIRRIAEEAGASLASIHYSFRDKEEVLAAVYEGLLGRAAELLGDAVPTGCGLHVAIERVMRAIYDWVVDERSLGFAQYELLFWAARTPSAGDLAATVYSRYRLVLRDALVRGGDADKTSDELLEIAQFVAYLLDGLTIHQLAASEPESARQHLDALIRIAIDVADGKTSPLPAATATLPAGSAVER